MLTATGIRRATSIAVWAYLVLLPTSSSAQSGPQLGIDANKNPNLFVGVPAVILTASAVVPLVRNTTLIVARERATKEWVAYGIIAGALTAAMGVGVAWWQRPRTPEPGYQQPTNAAGQPVGGESGRFLFPLGTTMVPIGTLSVVLAIVAGTTGERHLPLRRTVLLESTSLTLSPPPGTRARDEGPGRSTQTSVFLALPAVQF
jgi:hypothetical protein